MRFDRVIELRERLDTLIAQMSYGIQNRGPARKDRQSAQEIAELQGEHHRLDEVWKRARRAQEEVYSLEEIALTATLDGEPIAELLGDARAVYTRFRKTLTPLLVAQEQKRDMVTLLVTDLDDPHGHSLFVAPLLREARARRWSVEIHTDGGKPEPGDPPWPAARRWSAAAHAGAASSRASRREIRRRGACSYDSRDRGRASTSRSRSACTGT